MGSTKDYGADKITSAVTIASGGLDSTVLLYFLKREYGITADMLTFNYGQRHSKEINSAMRIAELLDARHDIVTLMSVGALLEGSALTDDDVEVPDGHYNDDTMKATVVPNRNAIMLSIAYGVAMSRNKDCVAIGVHSGDHHIYPDCRPLFIDAFRYMELASQGLNVGGVDLMAPFLSLNKKDIVTLGYTLGVPFEQTWTCYKGGMMHCGKCGACVERREAFVSANVLDKTRYEI